MTNEFARNRIVFPSGSARHRFGRNQGAGTGSILDDNRCPLHAANLVGHQACHDVDTTARREWDNDLDRSGRLRPGLIPGEIDKDGSQN
jgi:hypothetical protein